MQGSYQPKRPLGCLSAASRAPLEGGPCKRAVSVLVTGSPTRVGLQTRSRHKAYGNDEQGLDGEEDPEGCKHGHAIRRMETPQHCAHSDRAPVANTVTP